MQVFTAPYSDSEAEGSIRTVVMFGIQGKRLSYLLMKLERAAMKLRDGSRETCKTN